MQFSFNAAAFPIVHNCNGPNHCNGIILSAKSNQEIPKHTAMAQFPSTTSQHGATQSPECRSTSYNAASIFASPDVGPPRARSCLRCPQVLGGPCLALHLLSPSSCMHARVPLTSSDGSHDPARCLDRDRALCITIVHVPRTM